MIPSTLSVALSQGRYRAIEYYSSKINDVGGSTINLEKNDFRINRVKLLRAPVGTDGTPIITHRFFYVAKTKKDSPNEFLNGSTDVLDAYNHKTSYHYCANHRLSRFEKYTGNELYNLYSSENYVWKSNGNILCKRLENGSGDVLTAQVFEYDGVGNVLCQRDYGNISGNSPAIVLGKKGLPEPNGAECYAKYSTYSNDAWHLLLSQGEDNGKGYLYAYKSNTDLVTSKLTVDHGAIRIREFFEYDHNAVLIKKIKDDGSCVNKDDLSNVTERHITYIYPRKEAPIGLPEWIKEVYLDLATGQEKLLKKIHREFSKEGYLLSEEYYDADKVHQYTLYWEYNSHGKVILEKNALGEVIEKAYDENDNLVYEHGPNPNFRKAYVYDFSNQLICYKEIYPDGTYQITHHKYDLVGNRISTIDPSGNETQFRYDEFGRVVQTFYPPIPTENGELVRTSTVNVYDVQNNIIVFSDQRGESTHKRYNAHGNPVAISYPDGTHEAYEYNLDGTLRKWTSPNGSYTIYTNDCFGRVLREETYSPQNELLSRISSTYSSFHLTSTTDAAGHITTYQYDCAGRKISIVKGDRKTMMVYDSFGRLIRTTEWSNHTPESACTTISHYDLLDRVTEERNEDAFGNFLLIKRYKYDIYGNRTHEYSYTQAGESLTYTEYNARKKPTKIIDPEGNVTHVSYDYQFRNPFNQTVLQTTLTDPLGNQTLTTMNALNKSGSVIQKNAFGQITAKTDMFYDGIGNCQVTYETVITPGQQDRIVTTMWLYDGMCHLLRLSEAVGTPEQKVTRYRYNGFGQKEALIKPDGVEITYTYDAKGRLASCSSSNNTCAYSYAYNLNDAPVTISDLINNTTTSRSYDAYDCLSSETLANGLTLSYSYDKYDRLLHLGLPDGSGVDYIYNAAFLMEVHRTSSSAQRLYPHFNKSYDLSGNVQSSQLIAQAGDINYTYDLFSRVTAITHANWSQSVPRGGYNSVGNLVQFSIKDVAGYVDNQFTYDDLYQMTSESGNAAHQYKCDSVNNRVDKDNQPYTVNALNQVLQEEETCSQYIYDLNGNLVQKNSKGQVTLYEYDALDRMTSVVTADMKYVYTYDAYNRRIDKKAFSQLGSEWIQQSEVKFIYQEQKEIGLVDKGNIAELRILATGKGAEIGAAIALEIQGLVLAPMHDLNGNVVCLLNMTGQTVESYRYSAFGEEQLYESSGNFIASSSIGNAWRFSSKRVDPETGHIFFGQRYYDPLRGSWFTAYPLGLEDGPNLYAFVHNNPLTHVDLYGLYEESLWGSFCNFGTNLWNGFSNSYHEFSGGFSNGYANNWSEIGSLNMRTTSWTSGASGCYNFGECVGNGLSFMRPLEEGYQGITSYFSSSDPSMVRGELPSSGNVRQTLGGLFGASTILSSETQVLRGAKNGVALSRGAESVNAGININRKLSQLQDVQQSAVRIRLLPDGRIRYYDSERMSRRFGPTRGSSFVTEYNPLTGKVRGWNECYDHLGNVNRIHPKDLNGQKLLSPHYPPTALELKW